MSLWRKVTPRWPGRRDNPESAIAQADEPPADVEPAADLPNDPDAIGAQPRLDAASAATPSSPSFQEPEPISAGPRDSRVHCLDPEPLNLGSDPLDPLIADIVALNETSVRLENAIALAAAGSELPVARLSEYRALGSRAPELFMRKVLNFGRKSADELGALLSRVQPGPSLDPGPELTLSSTELRSALAGLFEGRRVDETIAEHDPPTRLPGGLDRLGYGQRRLSELLLAFPDLQPELLRLPNFGRGSVEAARTILGHVVMSELLHQRFSKDEAEAAEALLIERADLTPAERAGLARRLDLVGPAGAPEDSGTFARSESPPARPPAPALAPEELLPALLGALDARARDIVHRRFGLQGPAQTLEEVGQLYSVTRERIRQIEAKALRLLRHRARRRLTASIFEHGAPAWEALAGPLGFVLASALPIRKRSLSPWFLLGLEVAELTLPAWLDRFAVRYEAGWLPPGTATGPLDGLRRELESRLGDLALPCAISSVASPDTRDNAVALLHLSGRPVYGDYVLGELPRLRLRRALGLHAALGDNGLQPIADLVAGYRAHTPRDACSLRDAEIVMQTWRHLFVEPVEGVWGAVGQTGNVPAESVDRFDGSPEADDAADDETDALVDGTIAASLEAELRRSGPLRISVLIERAPDFLPSGRSVSSVGPVLITNKDRFARPLPGFYALPDQIPGREQLMRAPPPFIFREDQVRIYTLARRAGEAWGTFPLWSPETEYLWSRWARQNADPALLESLLSVIDVDAWPDQGEDKNEWRSLCAARGRFSIQYPPNLEPVAAPELEQVFKACLLVRHCGRLGWISANRVLWRRLTDHAPAGLLAVLIALGVVRAAADWQLPHKAGPRLDEILGRLAADRSRRGDLSWEQGVGPEMLRDAASAHVDFRWVEAGFLPRLLGGSFETPPEPSLDLSPLEMLLAERAKARRTAGVETALRTLSSDRDPT